MSNVPSWCWLSSKIPVFNFFQEEGLRGECIQQEICGGVFVHSDSGNAMGIKAENIDVFPEKYFMMDLNAVKKAAPDGYELRAIYHSHLLHQPKLSYADTQVMNTTGLDMVVISMKYREIRRFRKTGPVCRAIESFQWGPLQDEASLDVQNGEMANFVYTMKWFNEDQQDYESDDGLIKATFIQL